MSYPAAVEKALADLQGGDGFVKVIIKEGDASATPKKGQTVRWEWPGERLLSLIRFKWYCPWSLRVDLLQDLSQELRFKHESSTWVFGIFCLFNGLVGSVCHKAKGGRILSRTNGLCLLTTLLSAGQPGAGKCSINM